MLPNKCAADYVVARLGDELICVLFIKALLATEILWFYKLIISKDKGGLSDSINYGYNATGF